jgi:hypothetical protein
VEEGVSLGAFQARHGIDPLREWQVGLDSAAQAGLVAIAAAVG